MPRLFQRARVYSENRPTGLFDILDRDMLRCRSTHVAAGDTFDSRQDMARIRRFYFEPNYVMPRECQIAILHQDETGAWIEDSQRWRPTADIRTIRGTAGQVKEKAVDIAEVAE